VCASAPATATLPFHAVCADRHFLRLHDGTIIELFGEMEQQFGVSQSALQDMLRKTTRTHDVSAEGLFAPIL
jgi:hypothetical protein